jgi:hypothetical protein
LRYSFTGKALEAGKQAMFEINVLKMELENFFSRKYKLALLILASFASLC